MKADLLQATHDYSDCSVSGRARLIDACGRYAGRLGQVKLEGYVERLRGCVLSEMGRQAHSVVTRGSLCAWAEAKIS